MERCRESLVVQAPFVSRLNENDTRWKAAARNVLILACNSGFKRMQPTTDSLLHMVRGELRTESSSENSGLSVMCLYQDTLTHKQAATAFHSAVNGTPVRQQTWWKLHDFRQPGVLAGAVHTAMRADVIVLCLACDSGLPLPFYVWVNSWLPYRKVVGGTLVVRINHDASDDHQSRHALDYLRQAARQADMRFVVTQTRPSCQSRCDGNGRERCVTHRRAQTVAFAG